jgi:hypothetical protein
MGGRIGWYDSGGTRRRGGLSVNAAAHAEIVSCKIDEDARKAMQEGVYRLGLNALAIADCVYGARNVTPAGAEGILSSTAIVPGYETLGVPKVHPYADKYGVVRYAGCLLQGRSTAEAYGFRGVLADLRPRENAVDAAAQALHPCWHLMEGGTHHADSCTENVGEGTDGTAPFLDKNYD